MEASQTVIAVEIKDVVIPSSQVQSFLRQQAQVTWDKMVEFLKAQKITTQSMQTSSNLYDAFGLEAKLRDWEG